MSRDRLTLFQYDLLRELCEHCRKEKFHFVPTGADTAAGRCSRCGKEARMAEVTDTAVHRLVTQPNGDVVVVPVLSFRA
jgi:hypothetical protein